MSFDSIPLPLVLLATLVLVMLALHLGASIGMRRVAKGKGKLEVAGPMVGATMGLLAFMLAFTFNNAAARHEARKALVIKEANAIEQTWLRAGFLPDPSRGAMRELLKEYAEVRLNVALQQLDLAEGLHQTDQLQGRMWELALENGRQAPESIVLGLLIESLNEVIDLHLERLTVAIRARVPMPTWVTLYVLMVIGMGMVGLQIGGSGRHAGLEVALAVSFSVVLLMIADLDRPQQGLVTVSQQAMSELLLKLKAH